MTQKFSGNLRMGMLSNAKIVRVG